MFGCLVMKNYNKMEMSDIIVSPPAPDDIIRELMNDCAQNHQANFVIDHVTFSRDLEIGLSLSKTRMNIFAAIFTHGLNFLYQA
ncbi:hypothetical protein MTR67_042483 [Solanum verrucosum]|uniref:Uncharacterized protein n=1 Tax=Solanum verrucosum TaxID=315347 RepID=A0AAF0ZTF3_SOLVR|nr:hypothetical protein MTR67_042483 [Solanum verrucosum]